MTKSYSFRDEELAESHQREVWVLGEVLAGVLGGVEAPAPVLYLGLVLGWHS